MYIDVDVDIDIDVEVEVDVDEYFGILKGGFKVCSGTVECYTSSYAADFDNSEIASPCLSQADSAPELGLGTTTSWLIPPLPQIR